MKIYLVRHGQDKDNEKGILNGLRDKPLTEKGIQQAKAAAAKINKNKLKFHKIYTSPLKRTKQTAQIIGREIKNSKIETRPLLIERDFGIMTGVAQSRIVEICGTNVLKTDTITYFLTPKGAETFPQLKKRGKQLLRDLHKKHKDQTLLLVTHGDIGKMIYCAYYNLPWKNVLKMFHFGNSDVLEISKSSKPEAAHIIKTKQHNL